MTDTTHNGWTNYETWCVNLWLSNDEGLYLDVLALARDFCARGCERWRLADAIRDYVRGIPEASNVLSQASFVSDLLGAALGEVNWYEIASAWAQDAAEGCA